MVQTSDGDVPTLADHISMDDEEDVEFEPERLDLRVRSADL